MHFFYISFCITVPGQEQENNHFQHVAQNLYIADAGCCKTWKHETSLDCSECPECSCNEAINCSKTQRTPLMEELTGIWSSQDISVGI